MRDAFPLQTGKVLSNGGIRCEAFKRDAILQ